VGVEAYVSHHNRGGAALPHALSHKPFREKICVVHTTSYGCYVPALAKSRSSSRTASVNSLMHALLSVGRLMRQRTQGETVDSGSFWLLKTLAAAGPQRVTDLAVCAGLDASTVSRHIAQLHSAGLIERTPDPADGRAQRVKLSATGFERFEAALDTRRSLLEKCLEPWNPRDLEDLDRLLTRFAADVEALTQSMEKHD
jgi:DNA-binding MarR family transcriptional regulator